MDIKHMSEHAAHHTGHNEGLPEKPPAMKRLEIVSLIADLQRNCDYEQLNEYYNKSTIFGILGVSRNENRHSAFLSWLIDPKGSHGLGDFGLRAFLQMVILVKETTKQIENKCSAVNNEIVNPLVLGQFILENVEVESEKTIKGGRIDVYASFNLEFSPESTVKTRTCHLIIENKIFAKEGSEQTEKYYKHFEDKEKGKLYREKFYIYLSPLTSADLEKTVRPSCGCPYFIEINYQNLLEYVLEPCLNQCRDMDAKLFIGDYIRNLSIPSSATGDEKQNRKNLESILALPSSEKDMLLNLRRVNKKIVDAALVSMASYADPEIGKPFESLIESRYIDEAPLLDEDSKELLQGFWFSNENLFRAMLNADLRNCNQKPELQKAIQAILTRRPPRKRYQFGDVKGIGVGRLVLAVIKRYVEENPTATESSINKRFGGIKRNRDIVLKKEEAEVIDDGRRYFIAKNDTIVLGNGDLVCVDNQWGAYLSGEDNPGWIKFLEIAQREFPGEIEEL